MVTCIRCRKSFDERPNVRWYKGYGEAMPHYCPLCDRCAAEVDRMEKIEDNARREERDRG